VGQYLRLYRLSPEWAVEMLSGRKGVGDLKERIPESPIYSDPFSGIDSGEDPRQPSPLDRIDVRAPSSIIDWERNQLFIGRYYRTVADMLTGEFHNELGLERRFEVALDETEDPLDWAVFGRRICGWEIDLPLRYCTPSDLPLITEALQSLSNADLRSNLLRIAEEFPYDPEKNRSGYKADQAQYRLDHLLPYLLSNMRTFYKKADGNEEFVIHRIG